jgi:hypothetical protein
LGCAIALGLTAIVMAVPVVRARLGWNSAAPLSYLSGEKIDLDTAVYAGSTRTLIFFSRAGCSACQASQPAMAAITADLAKLPDVRVVMVTPAFSQDEQFFARSVGIDETRLFPVEGKRLRIRHVPAYVMVDASGMVLLTREGRVTDADREAIVRFALQSGAASP